MKKQLMIAVLSSLVAVYACKDKKTEAATEKDTTTTVAPVADAVPANDPLTTATTYTVTATPDTVTLGKTQQAFIKLKDLKAVALKDGDGKITGTELTYKIELTNRTTIGGSDIGLPTTDFRLELDNGTKIAPNSVFVAAAADATKISDDDKFTLPAGAKPTMLHLIFEQTKASIKIEIK